MNEGLIQQTIITLGKAVKRMTETQRQEEGEGEGRTSGRRGTRLITVYDYVLDFRGQAPSSMLPRFPLWCSFHAASCRYLQRLITLLQPDCECISPTQQFSEKFFVRAPRIYDVPQLFRQNRRLDTNQRNLVSVTRQVQLIRL